MDRPSLYDDDIVTWSEQQAAALRELGARAELSNAIDWENVAEEIESVGRSELRAIESLTRQMLVHLLKYPSAPDLPTEMHWRQEIAAFQAVARDRYEPAFRHRIDWDRVWRRARRDAASSLTLYGDRLLPNLPERCPVGPEDMFGEPFDVGALILKVAESIESKVKQRVSSRS